MDHAPPLHGLVLILGTRGSGKTTLLQHLEEEHRNGCPYHPGHRTHFVVWDTMGHWTPLPGRTVVDSDDPEEAARVAIELAPSVLLMDEIWDAFPSDNQPRRGSALNEIVRRGRQAKARDPWRRPGPVGLIGATQRPAGTAPALRGLASRLYLMHMSEPESLDWVAKAAAHRGGRQLAEQLPRLRVPQPGVCGPEWITVDL